MPFAAYPEAQPRSRAGRAAYRRRHRSPGRYGALLVTVLMCVVVVGKLAVEVLPGAAQAMKFVVERSTASAETQGIGLHSWSPHGYRFGPLRSARCS